MSAQAVRLYRDRGWRKPAGSVKVDRSSRWGNPFKVLEPLGRGGIWRVRFVPFRPGQARPSWAAEIEVGACATEHAAAASACLAFARWLDEPELAELVRLARRELRGKDLACWCPLELPCHRAIWLELVNAGGASPAEIKPGRGRPPITRDSQ